MKTFSELLLIFEQIKSYKSAEEIAKKHNVSLDFISKQLDIGIPIEHEHTKDEKLATIIALQHLNEIPDYYTKLKKMESSSKDKKIAEGTLHHWFKGSKSKGGKPGWVQADGSPCANEPGETKTPKCFSSARLRALQKKGKKGKALIRAAIRRKRMKDKHQQRKSGASSPTYVSTFSRGRKNPHYVKAEPGIKESLYIDEGQKDIPGKGSGTKDACYYKVKSRFDVWPSAYACVPEQSSNALSRDGWKNVNELNIGDEILTYNLEKDELEFKPILNIHRYNNVKTNVIQSGNNGFIFECTDNHKWVMNIPYQKGNRESKYKKINKMFFMETKELLEDKTNKRLMVSAPYNGGTFGFKQKDVEHRDAFLLSAFLNQGIVTWKEHKNNDIYSCNYTSNKRYKNTSNFNLIEERMSNVWCPETENSTWVMKQETNGKGIITITGNSASLVKCRKVGAANWGKSSKKTKLKEEYTRLQKAGNTYTILVSWKGSPKYIQMFFPNMKRPTKEEVNFETNKIYPGCIVLSFKPAKIDPTKPYLFAGETK
jgi:hypothetical protein